MGGTEDDLRITGETPAGSYDEGMQNLPQSAGLAFDGRALFIACLCSLCLLVLCLHLCLRTRRPHRITGVYS